MRRVVMLGALVLVGGLSVVGLSGQQGQNTVEVERLEEKLASKSARFATTLQRPDATKVAARQIPVSTIPKQSMHQL